MPGTVCSGHFYPNAAHFQIKWKLASPLKQTDTKMEKRLPKMGSLQSVEKPGSCIKRGPGFWRIADKGVLKRKENVSPSTTIWPIFSDSWQQI